MKGGKPMSNSKKQKMTLLLDSETINVLRLYADKELSTNSISQAVRSMAKEYGKRQKQERQKDI